MAMTAKQLNAYIGRGVVEIPNYINLERFQAAWVTAIARNAILRTRIVQTTSRVVQVVIAENVQWAISESLPEYLAEDRRKSMYLGDPLARWALIVNSQSRQFVWTIHHALYDGWTMPIINKQVYRAYCGDELGPRYNLVISFIILRFKTWRRFGPTGIRSWTVLKVALRFPPYHQRPTSPHQKKRWIGFWSLHQS